VLGPLTPGFHTWRGSLAHLGLASIDPGWNRCWLGGCAQGLIDFRYRSEGLANPPAGTVDTPQLWEPQHEKGTNKVQGENRPQ
jgi:hypothetical protein